MTFHTPHHEGAPLETKAEGDTSAEANGDVAEAVAAALEGIRADVVTRLEKLP